MEGNASCKLFTCCFTVSIEDLAHSSALCIDSKRAPGHEVTEMLQKI